MSNSMDGGASSHPMTSLDETRPVKRVKMNTTDHQDQPAARCPLIEQDFKGFGLPTQHCKVPSNGESFLPPQHCNFFSSGSSNKEDSRESRAPTSPQSSSSSAGPISTDTLTKPHSLDLRFPSVRQRLPLPWRRITAEQLRLDYAVLFPARVASELFSALEREVDYFTGDLARVKVFGKWHNIPRKQATYGDSGLTYSYSGVRTPARPWPPALEAVRNLLGDATGHTYNFVLVNRYKDGKDKMGEHKDDEKELDPACPIASVSLGQPRDFYFKHQDEKNKKRSVAKVNLTLEHGSVLLMRPPTNRYWYHALPPRASATRPRINLTFRTIMRKG